MKTYTEKDQLKKAKRVRTAAGIITIGYIGALSYSLIREPIISDPKIAIPVYAATFAAALAGIILTTKAQEKVNKLNSLFLEQEVNKIKTR